MSPTASPPKPSPARESSNEFGSASEFDSSKVSVVASGELPTAESDGKRPKRLIVASLVSVLMLSIVGYSMVASGTAATEQEESASNESLLPVRVLVVGSVRPPGLGREYAGLLIPDRESVLSFEGDGRIASINVEEGDLIRTGDVIAVLDQSHLDAKQRRIESELAAANARLDELVSGPRKQTVAAARAKVDELVARVELAKVEARRQEQLVPRGATSRSERDAAVFGLEAQEKELLAARSALEQLAEGTRAEQLAEQRARCQAIEASLEEVAAERDDATIIAPFSGRIEQRFVDEGTVVSSGIQVVKLVSQLVEAEVGLPPSVASNLTTGERVTLRLRGQDRDAWIDR
ncbi:MAG: biotin/lipoyl-binding protein, partial [Planctomycetota bacterium]